MPLDSLLRPKSIVVVGASDSSIRIGGRTMMVLEAFRDDAQVAGVNPKYETIFGFPCYPTIGDLPFVPDVALLAVSAERVPDTLHACAAKGVPAAIVFAAGFSDLGTEQGKALQAQVAQIAAASDMSIAGPNTFGIVNFVDRRYATFNPLYIQPAETSFPRTVAILSQGGGPCSIAYEAGRLRGVGFSYAIASGNEAVVSFEDYLDHLADDPNCGTIVAYLEGVREGGDFLRVAAKLRDAGKPLSVYMVGHTEAGAAAALSHTARMTTGRAHFKAAFRQLNIVEAEDVDMLAELGYLFQFKQRKSGLNAGIVTASGALNAIFTDTFTAHGLTVPRLSEALQDEIRALVPSWGSATHPIDLSPSISEGDVVKILKAMFASSGIDFITFFSTGPLIERWTPALIEAAKSTDKLLCIMFAGECRTAGELEKAGVAIFRDTTKGGKALSAFAHWHHRRGMAPWEGLPAAPHDPAPVPACIAAARREGRLSLDEYEAKMLLAGHGVPTAAEHVARTADEAAAAATALGFPVVMKILSSAILHKTEAGGVRLGIGSENAARAAFAELAAILGGCGEAEPAVLVQKQVAAGVEILVSVTEHPSLGPCLTLASGGTAAELLMDVVHRVLPVDRSGIRDALGELALFPLLDGYRGAPKCDVDALVAAIDAVADAFARLRPHVGEIEINPMIVGARGKGATVVDCVLALAAETHAVED